MTAEFINDVYLTLQGELVPEAAVAGVENLFEEGNACYAHYAAMHCAYERLRARLGVDDEDKDVEVIIHSLMAITDILAKRMFEHGAQFGNVLR